MQLICFRISDETVKPFHLISRLFHFFKDKSMRVNAHFFAVSLSGLPPSVPPLQSLYPGRKSRSACGCHLLYHCLLHLTLLSCHRVVLCSWILLWVCNIHIQLWRHNGQHVLWKMNPPVLLNSPLMQKKRTEKGEKSKQNVFIQMLSWYVWHSWLKVRIYLDKLGWIRELVHFHPSTTFHLWAAHSSSDSSACGSICHFTEVSH